MKTLTTLLATLCLAVAVQGQTVKSLGYNTTNGQVVYSGTNPLTFTNNVNLNTGILGNSLEGSVVTMAVGLYDPANDDWVMSMVDGEPQFNGTNVAFNFRNNLGLGATWLTNTNVTNLRSAIGLGATNNVSFNSLYVQDRVDFFSGIGASLTKIQTGSLLDGSAALVVSVTNQLASIFTASNFVQSGNITINQSTTNNGLLFIYRTNAEPFLGLANLIASNNTTISNETLFRVGVAEATNKAAQFGFRTVRTNNGGEGFATFSVFGYNALMMIGPSDRSRSNSITNTNAAIEADIYSIGVNDRVMTLIDTNTAAMTLHRELGWSTNNITTNAPANTTNVALWLRVWVGTNAYRLPLYQ